MDDTDGPSAYTALLAGCTELPAPLDRAAFTMLTVLLTPAELFHPATRIERGHVSVPGSRARCVPLARASSLVLGGDGAAVRALLGIGSDGLRSTSGLEPLEDSGGPFAGVPPWRLHAVAVEHLVHAAPDHDLRRAVLAYAGLPVDGRLGGVDPAHHRKVGALIDQQVRAAGMRVCDGAHHSPAA